jgi:phenylpropionate dioxygenase-like ring-hydroxylating dioxygenase large terminal subunit
MVIDTTPRAEPATEMMRTLPQAAYLSDEHFAREADRIFHREWFAVGRQDAIPSAGDYLHVEVAGESVLVVRSRSGTLGAFYNVCRHRGSRLVMEDPHPDGDGASPSGRFKGSIRCPYHAWTYGLEGRLRNAPFLTESDGLRREQLSLHPIAVEMWGGFIFVNLTPSEITPERSLLGRLDGSVERTQNYPLADLRLGSRITYDVDTNWKTIVENYNECYHCGPVHPELCELVPAFKQDGGRELDWDTGVPHRDGATTFTFTGTTTREPFPGLSEDERVRHKGELIYPNLMLSLSADHVVAFTLWPLDAGHTRIDCDFLFHADEMAKPGFDPADAVDFWDLVNRQDWEICASVQKGMSSRAFSFGYYAPMEDLSLDIRRYLADTLGDVPTS